jgi:hypothetical protein
MRNDRGVVMREEGIFREREREVIIVSQMY